jgi:flavoprotein
MTPYFVKLAAFLGHMYVQPADCQPVSVFGDIPSTTLQKTVDYCNKTYNTCPYRIVSSEKITVHCRVPGISHSKFPDSLIFDELIESKMKGPI